VRNCSQNDFSCRFTLNGNVLHFSISSVDDLVATGGTLIAACDLLASVGATIVECACMVELKMLGGYGKLQAKHPGVKVITFKQILEIE
jgi:phosphoribosylpyrophosphate synthetase